MSAEMVNRSQCRISEGFGRVSCLSRLWFFFGQDESDVFILNGVKFLVSCIHRDWRYRKTPQKNNRLAQALPSEKELSRERRWNLKMACTVSFNIMWPGFEWFQTLYWCNRQTVLMWQWYMLLVSDRQIPLPACKDLICQVQTVCSCVLKFWKMHSLNRDLLLVCVE